MMELRRHEIALFLFLSVLMLVSLPSSLAAAERVRASYAAVNASQSPLWVARERGFYAKYGLDVDLIFISSGSLNVQALVGGTVQFAAAGPAALEARLRGPKLLTIANPLTILATNLVTLPELKSIADLKGKVGGISRFGSSTHQGLRYLFRANGLSVETDLKMLQLGGDSSRLVALKTGRIQYTFLGAAASEQARTAPAPAKLTGQSSRLGLYKVHENQSDDSGALSESGSHKEDKGLAEKKQA